MGETWVEQYVHTYTPFKKKPCVLNKMFRTLDVHRQSIVTLASS